MLFLYILTSSQQQNNTLKGGGYYQSCNLRVQKHVSLSDQGKYCIEKLLGEQKCFCVKTFFRHSF